eukprot:m.170518 g.170518  ORF g.170518 m.170518 type:complete len:898 (+) comp15276_c5_seq1:542-3235(+)
MLGRVVRRTALPLARATGSAAIGAANAWESNDVMEFRMDTDPDAEAVDDRMRTAVDSSADAGGGVPGGLPTAASRAEADVAISEETREESGRVEVEVLGVGSMVAAGAGAGASESKSDKPAEEKKRELTPEEVEELITKSELYKRLEERLAELEAQLVAEREKADAALQQEQAAHKEVMDSMRRASMLDNIKSRPDSTRPIDIFSDILDLRAKADSAFNAHDHLPRVVVVGDQSAGKTSVLEVLVRAHIFPRGLGEMMTRAPIQVTLSEGPQHVATVKGSDRVFDLSNNIDLADLRRDIERRMVASIKPGEVVSMQTLAIDVRGPGLAPMVLVDLPGIIQHHTQGMAASTKTSILSMCQQHIANPNSIILCIQDATRDAEGSSVADVVHEADPTGQRTVFVLTKVDLAEQLRLPSAKVRSILRGQRFNVKAKSYFAVVTGTANPNDSIEAIRKNEKSFFDRSQFVREGAFNPRNAGIDNLSKAVSEIFWERVKETVVAESKEVALALRRKENEWKNTYPNTHRHSRDDLFNMGRTRILENMNKLAASATPIQYETMLRDEIIARTRPFFLSEIYIRSADAEGFSGFKTNVQNALDVWVSKDLPSMSVEIARSVVLDEIGRVLDIDDKEQTYSALAAHIRATSTDTVKWHPAAASKLASIQELMLMDDVIKSRKDWVEAAGFMHGVVTAARDQTLKQMAAQAGPSTYQQWTSWKSPTPLERARKAIMGELASFFPANTPLHAPALSADELTAVQQNLQRRHQLMVEPAQIEDAFKLLYNFHFFTRAQATADFCRSRFGVNPAEIKAPNGLGCTDVAMFWRYSNMVNATANVLRLESMEYRQHLEGNVRQQLDTLSSDHTAKQTLISGKKVALAEEIEILRVIQNKLDAFIKAIRKEDS